MSTLFLLQGQRERERDRERGRERERDGERGRERERKRERAREGDLILMTKKAAKKLIGSINDSISDPRLCYNTFPQIQGTNLPI
jgi:hypothetical protein